MTIAATIRSLLPTLAVAGLLLAPFAQASFAMPTSMDAAVSDRAEMADPSGMVMSDGMPCCPQDPQKDCAKDCLLMGLCVGQLYSTVPVYAFTVLITAASPLLTLNDRRLDPLSQGPPSRPPKT